LMIWVARPDWAPILDGYARCVRIVRSQTKDGGPWTVDESKFVDEAEKALFQAVKASVVRPPSSVDEFLTTIEKLIPSITEFFDKVLVMAEDPAVRGNRLGLLQQIAGLANGIADLSKLEGF
jgi:glycyl-tRNA synthetase beta subunit